MSDLIGPVEAARILGVTYLRVWQLAVRRQIPFVWKDFARQFEREDIEKFRDNRLTTRPPSTRGDVLVAEVAKISARVTILAEAYRKIQARVNTLKTSWHDDDKFDKLDAAWEELELAGDALFQAHVEYKAAFSALNKNKTLVRRPHA
jgi:hypothetical protein